MKRHFLIVAGVLLAFSGFGQNYPFPMNEQGYSYPYGISATNPSNATIQSKFVAWEKAMYTENSDKTLARIKYDDGTSTVSEGIAYGMLIYVYMANATNTQCQDHFDKLYAYYKKWADGNGLMNWKITGFDGIASGGNNGATDADLDVALALCMAAKQWESSSKYVYADEAEKLLKIIYDRETFNKNNMRLFKPGDSWDNVGNPCYFTVASVGAFIQAQEKLGFITTRNWSTVYKDSHTYLEKTQRGGVWPNWSDWSYNPTSRSGISDADEKSKEMDFGWDACRVPWRIAWDYVWFGNESSKNMMAKTIELLDTKGWQNSPNSVGFMTGLTENNGYSSIKLRSSESYSAGNVAWTGSVGCAFMVDETRQDNLDKYYSQNCGKTGGAYYAQTLQVLYMLTMSGNAANFFDCGGSSVVSNPVITSATTNGNTIVLTSSKALQTSSNYSGFSVYQNGTKLTNAISNIAVSERDITLTLNNSVSIESTDGISILYEGNHLVSTEDDVLGKVVYFPVKNTVPGGSTILADCENGEVTLLGGKWYSYVGTGSQSYEITTGGANSTAHSAHFTYSNVSNYAGMGFNILLSEEANDFSGSTGITFYHKGNAVQLEVGTSSVGDYSYHIFNIDYHSSWSLVTVNWSDLNGPGWGTGNSIDFVENKLYSEIEKFQWKVTSGSGEFYIDEVTVIGKTIGEGDVDRSALETTIVTANMLYGGATIERYPESAITALYNAIVTAGSVDMNSSAIQTQVNTANANLTAAISEFKSKEIKVVDKTLLRKSITTATLLKNESVVGNENGQFPQSAMDDLVAAIAAANTVNESESATEMEVSDATTTLNTAVQKFKNSKISRADKTELKNYIDLAENILATTEAGTEVGQYDEKKRSSLETSLRSAKVQYEKETASQSMIDLVAGSLKTAYESYQKSKITTTAVDEMEYAVSVFPNPCAEVLNIEANEEIAFVRIISLTGSKTVFVVNQATAQIYVASLSKGIYNVQIIFADGSVKTTQFIKK
ncbi:MAG: T9SS type A sorting domain-containing protein [Bacteroidales bacterium]|nr:T9SS type A sorting domain-containing protein [Bacteroidales bacterium]